MAFSCHKKIAKLVHSNRGVLSKREKATEMIIHWIPELILMVSSYINNSHTVLIGLTNASRSLYWYKDNHSTRCKLSCLSHLPTEEDYRLAVFHM